MTALPESPATSHDCGAVVDEFAGRLSELDPGFLRMLRQFLQVRLGTSAEHPCDAERVQALSSEINHRSAAAILRRDRPRLDDGIAPFPH